MPEPGLALMQSGAGAGPLHWRAPSQVLHGRHWGCRVRGGGQGGGCADQVPVSRLRELLRGAHEHWTTEETQSEEFS